MIDLQLTKDQAIALDALIRRLPLLNSPTFPDIEKQELSQSHAENQDLKDIGEKVAIALSERMQEENKIFLNIFK